MMMMMMMMMMIFITSETRIKHGLCSLPFVCFFYFSVGMASAEPISTFLVILSCHLWKLFQNYPQTQELLP